MVYLDFEEDDPAWINHQAEFVRETRPFSGVRQIGLPVTEQHCCKIKSKMLVSREMFQKEIVKFT